MQSFDFQRFISILKHDITENRRSYLRFLAGTTVGCFLILYCFTGVFNPFTPSDAEQIFDAATVALYPTYGFLLWGLATLAAVAWSHIFSNMGTKQSRLNFLMLPATNLEKYLCRWLQYVVLAPIGILLALLLADACCAVARMTFHYPFIMCSLTLLTELPSAIGHIFADTPWPAMLLMLFVPASASATFVLGGTLFRRVPFVMTNVALWGLNMALTCVGGLLAAFIDFETIIPALEHVIDAASTSTSVVIIELLLAAWTAGCYWLSFRMFCRSSVVGHKTFGM